MLAASPLLLAWQADPARQISLLSADFLAFHTGAEVFAIVVAALVFVSGNGAGQDTRFLRPVLLGQAFLAVALFDLLHLLAYEGMPDLGGPNSPQKAILLWLAGRYLAVAGILAYVLLPEHLRIGNATRRLGVVAVLGLVSLVGWSMAVHPDGWPETYIDGEGLTALKVGLEWSVFALLLIAVVLLYRWRHRVTQCDVPTLGLALLLLASSELYFTVYVQVNSTANLLGHAYKVAAYYFLYHAIYADSAIRQLRQMRHMLVHDDLTGLPNRAAFGEQLTRAVTRIDRSWRGGALLLLDIDHFKNVNDTLGHERGDQLLVAVAGRLRDALPASAYLARFSGDEFVILLEGATSKNAAETVQNLQKAMAGEFELGDDRLEVAVSLGLVTYPAHGATPTELMQHADLALHRAKQEGRDRLCVFSAELAQAVHRRVLLEGRLRHALERNELRLVYQPKVALSDGRLAGWEALLRWEPSGLGPVSPEEFIPVAEQSGLILPIGEWVLREACRQLKVWQEAGLDGGSVAVNLSPRQFRQRDLAAEVRRALAETGLAPGLLELELTESAIMDNLSAAAAVLGELEDLGVRVAVDDFGTGYSSLAYLKHLPIHCLKVDRSFIRDIPGDDDDAAIVRAIITLARSLGLTVVAEGVENEAQLASLRADRCDLAQGWLFSKPLPPDDCAALLREARARAA